jgi:hypothetical protein
VEEFRTRRAAQEARKAQAARAPSVIADLPALLSREYGLSKEDVALAIYNGVYGLHPDDPSVPVDFKLKVHAREQARQVEQAQQAQEQQAQEQYQYALAIAARTAKEDAFPESVAWYDGNHARYTAALTKTALALAADAQASGFWADLSPQAVQRKLESDLAERFAKVEQKKAGRKSAAAKLEEKTEQKVTTSVVSTVGATSGAKTPTGRKSRVDAEREADAILERWLTSTK